MKAESRTIQRKDVTSSSSDRGKRDHSGGVPVNRLHVGLLALTCLAASLGLFVFGSAVGPARLWAAAFLRVGLLMAVFWWALPSDRPTTVVRVPARTLAGIVLAVFAVARYPRTVFPLLLVIALIGWLLRPRTKRSQPHRSSKPRDAG